jgi:hypothetical protein
MGMYVQPAVQNERKADEVAWYEDLPFELVIPVQMPKRDLTRWRKSLTVVAAIAESRKINLTVVRLHYHNPPKSRSSYGDHHPMGEAETDFGEVTLCANDVDTAVHELAHIITKENHTKKWAETYIKLATEYMPIGVAKRALRHASKFYKTVQKQSISLGLID